MFNFKTRCLGLITAANAEQGVNCLYQFVINTGSLSINDSLNLLNCVLNCVLWVANPVIVMLDLEDFGSRYVQSLFQFHFRFCFSAAEAFL